MPKQLSNFEQDKLDKIKNEIEVTSSPSLQEEELPVPEQQEPETKAKSGRKFQTSLGTEASVDDVEKIIKARANKQESKFSKDLNEILVNVSQERLTRITDALKKNILKLERVKDDGSGVVVDNKDYIPLTIGQNKKVMKVMKHARLLREDLNGMGEDGGLAIGDIQKKYPDILDEDVTQDEVNNEDILNELIGNYVIAQKARIYWGIDSVENYVLSDIILIIHLYEQRNNFTPT